MEAKRRRYEYTPPARATERCARCRRPKFASERCPTCFGRDAQGFRSSTATAVERVAQIDAELGSPRGVGFRRAELLRERAALTHCTRCSAKLPGPGKDCIDCEDSAERGTGIAS